PCSRANAIRSSFCSSAPALSTIAVLPRVTTGVTISLTSLLGAHSTTISAASARSAIGNIFGGLFRAPSPGGCLCRVWGAMLVRVLGRDRSQHQAFYPPIEFLGEFGADGAKAGDRDPQSCSFRTRHFVLPQVFSNATIRRLGAPRHGPQAAIASIAILFW